MPTLRRSRRGRWGDRPRATLAFTAAPLLVAAATAARCARARARAGRSPPAAAAARSPTAAGRCASSSAVRRIARPDRPGCRHVATLDVALGEPDRHGRGRRGDARRRRRPTGAASATSGLGLAAGHPRWLGRVLCAESRARVARRRLGRGQLRPASAALARSRASRIVAAGSDGYAAIVPDDFFDAGWVPGDEPDDRARRACTRCSPRTDVAIVVVAGPLRARRPASAESQIVDPGRRAGPVFETLPCDRRAAPPAPPAPPPLERARLDPARRAGPRADRRAAAPAGRPRRGCAAFVALLDVPPGLTQRRMLAWRARVRLGVRRGLPPVAAHGAARPGRRADGAGQPRRPSRRASSRARELRGGVPRGPANELAARIVDVEDRVGAGAPRRTAPVRRQRLPARARRRAPDRRAHALPRRRPGASSACAGCVSLVERSLPRRSCSGRCSSPTAPRCAATLRHALERLPARPAAAGAFARRDRGGGVLRALRRRRQRPRAGRRPPRRRDRCRAVGAARVHRAARRRATATARSSWGALVADDLLLTAFRFRVRLLRSADVAAGGAVTSELSGAALRSATARFAGVHRARGRDGRRRATGGRAQRRRRAARRAASKYPQIVLKRGMFHPAGGAVNRELWRGSGRRRRRAPGRAATTGSSRS